MALTYKCAECGGPMVFEINLSDLVTCWVTPCEACQAEYLDELDDVKTELSELQAEKDDADY